MTPPILLNGPIRNLSRIWRYSSIPLHEPESVMEHNAWVSWISMQIVHWYRSINDGRVSLNTELVYELAIIHDFAECFTGDMIRPIKYSSKEFLRAYRELERQSVRELLNQLPESVRQPVLRTLSQEGGNPNQLEVRIVKLADLLSVWGKLAAEAYTTNQHAAKELEKSTYAYRSNWLNDPDLGDLVEEVLKEFENG